MAWGMRRARSRKRYTKLWKKGSRVWRKYYSSKRSKNDDVLRMKAKGWR
jgi:hypothetical protein